MLSKYDEWLFDQTRGDFIEFYGDGEDHDEDEDFDEPQWNPQDYEDYLIEKHRREAKQWENV
jgi:hypothetical protein